MQPAQLSHMPWYVHTYAHVVLKSFGQFLVRSSHQQPAEHRTAHRLTE